jgi:hypothetical protein
LSALTESRILRTASLEFDIGFLLDVNFLARRQLLRTSGPFACAPQSVLPGDR